MTNTFNLLYFLLVFAQIILGDNEADKYKAIIAQKCEEIEEKVKQINELEVQKQEEIQRLHQEV